MEFFFSKHKSIAHIDGVHLIQDHIGTSHSAPWNDYDYIATFNAIVVMNRSLIPLGELKLLVNGSKDTSQQFIRLGAPVADEKTYNITEILNPDNTVSLASNAEFYEALRNVFTEPQVIEYLDAICDAGYYSERLETYRSWPGFSETILRSSTAEALIKKGYRLAQGTYRPDETPEINIESLPETFEPISFKFNNKTKLGAANINLLIGPNGTGKSHILKHLSEVATGISEHSEKWPFFHKIIISAYSPFENFHTSNDITNILINKHGQPRTQKKYIKRKLSKINKYSYIGFRNELGKFQLDWPKEHSAKSIIKIIELDNDDWWGSNTRMKTLIDTLKISIDFDSIHLNQKDSQATSINIEKISRSKELLKNIDYKSGITFFKDQKEMPLSSGQIMYSYMIPALVSEIENESLILLDEPELYLHPSLEVGLISMLRNLLDRTSSYAIIATHSAVLAREINQENIRILKSSKKITTIGKPTFETYGGSLDLILGAAFDDYNTPKPFQADLDKVILENNTIKDAIDSMDHGIGDEALAYIASKYAELDEQITIDTE